MLSSRLIFALFLASTTALAAETFLREQESALVRAAAEAETAVKLALGQYERGLSEVLTESGRPVVVIQQILTRHPGGPPGSERIRPRLLNA